MAQNTATQVTSDQAPEEEAKASKHLLGPLLCWAVVFADIGTSVYYVPGILYGTVGRLAGFFVFLTMTVFVLLTLKYAEVTDRFPQGGGVVTVAAQAMNHWVGALGGMFILVDYFLTAAISCLSGMLYLSVVLPSIGPYTLEITIGVLVLLGILNWVGVSESAKVSLVGAVIAFGSDIAILVTVFTHISFSDFLSLFSSIFKHEHLTVVSILTGFAGSFLAFSGLESISQLSPVMKTPRKRVAGIALLLVVLTIGVTSPVLTVLATLLQPREASDPVLSAQLISLLAGHWGSIILQTEVAISASALLVFASNTAIIGSYHVFMALSRMDFFPAFVLRRNKLRGTPHYSIALATGIPIAVLVLVRGNINILGDLYAFGLLGAFTLTSLGLDILRYRERRALRAKAYQWPNWQHDGHNEHTLPVNELHDTSQETLKNTPPDRHALTGVSMAQGGATPAPAARRRTPSFWSTLNFWLGILTTLLVFTAWTTNLVSKPLATAFGGSVASVGMIIAYINYQGHKRRGRAPVVTTGIEGRLPGSVLAVLVEGNEHNDAVIHSAIDAVDGHPVVFLYVGNRRPGRLPSIFELYDPYLEDQQAKETLGHAEHVAQRRKIARRYVYKQEEPGVVAKVWKIVHPRDTVVTADLVPEVQDINPDRIRYELTPKGKVAHLLKQW